LDHIKRVNNPYTTRWARYYDRILKVPPMRQIRRSEESTLEALFALSFRPGDSVLEVGPGTGRYTVEFARRVAGVTAVEHSPHMVAQLCQRLEREGVRNCAIIEGEFVRTRIEPTFDVVAIIGVLDYVVDPATFLGKAATLARREIVFTTPYCSFLAKMHRAGNRLRGIAVTTYTQEQIRSYLPGFHVEIAETGLNTPLWRGLTLACRATRL
jgi:cyclopropane fatty-acyl-phospholipid synthase-like methyltransferase